MDGSSVSSFGAPAVTPRSPPASLDLYGKRTQMVKIQALEREIGLLQEELKSVEGLQPASRYCKEVDDFIGAKQDPIVTNITQKIHQSHPFWKHLWERNCFFPWFCCCFSCTCHLKMPSFCSCCISGKSRCPQCSCLQNTSCLKSCSCGGDSCPTCACCRFGPFFCKCNKVNSCCGWNKASYSSYCQ